MTHNFKPGDVALATVRGEQGVRIFRTGSKRGLWKSAVIGGVGVDSMQWHGDEHVRDLRPLAAIDYEDAGQVERLQKAIENAERSKMRDFWEPNSGVLAAALREFANPTPPIEEPTGLGAVVEDAEGKRYIRTADTNCRKPWSYANSYSDHDYAEIAAVRVLSEGVTP